MNFIEYLIKPKFEFYCLDIAPFDIETFYQHLVFTIQLLTLFLSFMDNILIADYKSVWMKIVLNCKWKNFQHFKVDLRQVKSWSWIKAISTSIKSVLLLSSKQNALPFNTCLLNDIINQLKNDLIKISKLLMKQYVVNYKNNLNMHITKIRINKSFQLMETFDCMFKQWSTNFIVCF